MWEVHGRPMRSLGHWAGLVPDRVLYDFDGPRIFTSHDASGELLLVYLCDESDDIRRFLVVRAEPEMIARLEQGRLAVREALTTSPAWLIDLGPDQIPCSAWDISVERLPADALPRPGILLWPTLKLIDTLPEDRRAGILKAERLIRKNGLMAA